MNKNQYQQGDVIFRRIKAVRAIGIKGRHVLAEGEVTGHSHTVESEDEAELIRIGDRLLLKVKKQATVRHQEHKPVTLPRGVWDIGRVREIDHLTGMVDPVRD